MYCMNCGKENPDGVKYCCFCGTAANTAPRSIEEISDKISENLTENGQLEIEDAADITSVISEALSEKTDENPAENASGDAAANPAPPASSAALGSPIAPAAPVNNASPAGNPSPSNPYAFPQPLPINKSGNSPAPGAAQTAQNMNISIKNAVPEEKQGVERTFTIKHIIICLVSTAVCAIAAGIFAGLYFSVV